MLLNSNDIRGFKCLSICIALNISSSSGKTISFEIHPRSLLILGPASCYESNKSILFTIVSIMFLP